MNDEKRIPVLNLPLERDNFLRTLIRHLSGTLEEVIGLDEASGFISVVGQRMGEEINEQYRSALSLDKLSPTQVSAVLVDLKRRIKGDFYVIEQDEQKIVLGNNKCPFGDKVHNRPSMCMMTSSVFGTITADNLGYARVSLEKTIANGDGECCVVIHLTESDNKQKDTGIEYYQG
ncbi:transcriptional regulator [Salinimonas marina]|uniref:Transcriptional regulator n=1 Tax=Salinimonas marina TaxID=2785918 RepID=A0A7S9HD16_9ALTE|nr:methanogen output domain 1-containing protein [Salinimonas marina]QPG05086.1 transcriptional regulator [Salinimonas marina]